jgi:hypothetical protein
VLRAGEERIDLVASLDTGAAYCLFQRSYAEALGIEGRCMRLPKMMDEAFLRLAREEDNCSISAGSMRGAFRKKRRSAAGASAAVRKTSRPLSKAEGVRYGAP